MRDGILMADRQKVNMSAGSEDTAALIAKFTPMIRAKAARMKTGSIETDDLVSEGFLGLLSAIRCYKPEKGSFGAFASVCIAVMTEISLSSDLPPKISATFFFIPFTSKFYLSII